MRHPFVRHDLAILLSIGFCWQPDSVFDWDVIAELLLFNIASFVAERA
jgi:hypothetical protein